EKRDFCFVMNKDITCAMVEKEIASSCVYISKIDLFDIYEGAQLGENKKSLAFSVVFTPKDEEFKPEVIDGFVNTILSNLKEKYDVTLRA
ncbi:MAG: phenylalanine--tRNA ligase subunit beta, partial [Clostridiales bacterium]|nr:phenylalanine--tRNA ligase subunit beta [Clostridiales bacterium]